jgi:T5SS/PEP-CTERM-associated repeat protein
LAALYLAGPLPTLHAAIVPTGSVIPADPKTWTSSTYGFVGNTGYGDVTVDFGSDLNSYQGYIGYNTDSTGVVTVDGTGSTWTNNSDLFVGQNGDGTLNITNGGAVSNSNGRIGHYSSSAGVVTVDGTDSTWTNSWYLYVGQDGDGTLNITNGGAVSNNRHGYIGLSNDSTGVVTVDGNDSTWNSPYLHVGYNGDGTLNITNGGTVNNIGGGYISYIGHYSSSTGVATVDGGSSTWINSGGDLYVGNEGSGTLSITDGGTVSNQYGKIGYSPDSTGVVTVDGGSSTWTNNSHLFVGNEGSGTLSITGGGTVSNQDYGSIGYYLDSTGVVTVDGTDSTWTNNSSLFVGHVGDGTLNITNGGSVTALEASINSQSLLAIDVGNGSLLTVDGGSGTITNDGVVRVMAGAGSTAGAAYAPISAGTWSGGGIYQAVGGTWNATTHVFTVSEVEPGTSGTPVTIDLAVKQCVLIGDGGAGWSLGVSFATTGSSTSLTLTATAISGDVLDDLEALLDPGQAVLGGWELEAAGYTDPAYLSFDVGAGFSRSDLHPWHYDGNEWIEFDAMDLTYDGQYASFTVRGFSGYAVTAVPEPGTLVSLLIGAATLALLTRRCSRRQRFLAQ